MLNLLRHNISYAKATFEDLCALTERISDFVSTENPSQQFAYLAGLICALRVRIKDEHGQGSYGELVLPSKHRREPRIVVCLACGDVKIISL